MKQLGGSGAAEQVHFGCHDLQHSAKPKLDSLALDSAERTTHTYMVKTHLIPSHRSGELQLPVQERKGAGIVLGTIRVYDGVYQRASEVQLRNFEGNGIV